MFPSSEARIIEVEGPQTPQYTAYLMPGRWEDYEGIVPRLEGYLINPSRLIISDRAVLIQEEMTTLTRVLELASENSGQSSGMEVTITIWWGVVVLQTNRCRPGPLSHGLQCQC